MFLQNEIRHKVKELSRLDPKRIKLKSDLRVTTSFFDYTHLFNAIEVSTTGRISGVLATHKKKLDRLGYTDKEVITR